MVLDQFVLSKGNPNWRDWCFDSDYSQAQANAWNQELDDWSDWPPCSGLSK